MQSFYPQHPSLLLLETEQGRYRAMQEEDFLSSRASSAISADPQQYSNAPNNFTPATGSGTIFTLNSGDKGFIQNLGTSAIAVKKGSGASQSSFSFLLKGGMSNYDANGGFANLNDWIGDVSLASMSTGCLYIAWKVSL